MIVALAERLGRPPSAAEIKGMLREYGLRSQELGRLLDASGSHLDRAGGSETIDRTSSLQAAHLIRAEQLHGTNQADDDSALGQATTTVRAPTAPGDKLVQRTVDDLIDDWHRAGGHLSFEDVARLSTKRGLDAGQMATLLSALREQGVGIDGAGAERSSDDTLDAEATELDRPAGRDVDIVGSYLREISRYPLLNAEQEVSLGRQIRAGLNAEAAIASHHPESLPPEKLVELRLARDAGRAAHQQLVRCNLRLVVNFAKSGKYRRSGVEFIDRIQDGNIGLMRAADKFDATMGFKFSTYASWWIRQFIERGIADRGSLIRLPAHVHEKLQRCLRARARLEYELDRNPTLQEIAQAADMESGRVQAILDYSRMVLSLDAPVSSDGETTLGDYLAEAATPDADDPFQKVAEVLLHEQLQLMLCDLASRERFVLEQRFGLGDDEERSLQQVGEAMGITRERVRQLQDKALAKLRHPKYSEQLIGYLPVVTRP
jgi:RNA polymerase sigma factor (sigma-70 family)